MLDLASVAAGAESLSTFAAARREDVDGLLEVVRRIGDFTPEAMKMLGRPEDCTSEVTAESLTLYSACIEEYPPNLDDPGVLRRILHMGGDLQLASLMHGLVVAAMVRGPGAEEGAALVVEAVRAAASLLGLEGTAVPETTFRIWRVAHLPGVLRPNAASPETARAYAHALETELSA